MKEMQTFQHATIFALAMMALILMASEAETLEAVIISRVIGLSLCVVIYYLSRYWRKRGGLKMEE